MTGKQFKAIMINLTIANGWNPGKWAEEMGYEIGWSARSMQRFARMKTIPKRVLATMPK